MNSKWRFEKSAFGNPGNWFKGGFHCHTQNSDGGLSPAETIQCYRELGFHCLGITDHKQVTEVKSFSDAGFITINSTENGGIPDVIGVDATSAALPVELPFCERVSRLAQQGAFTIAAHPAFCAATPDQYIDCPDLMALEIFNAYCEEAYANGVATEIWDMVLGAGKRVWGVAGDDAHLNPKKRYYSNAGKAWVVIWCEEFSLTGILRALKNGAFYSTQGPRFKSILVEERSIEITCSPVCQIRWKTYGRVGYVDYPAGNGWLNRSILPDGFEPTGFVRIELIDCEGLRAWSNPFFISERS